MRKRKLRLALAILLLAVLGGLTWLVVAPPEPPEPVYQGKKLRVWLAAYNNYYYSDPYGMYATNSIRAANEAISQMGTNCIPILLNRLKARDSGLKLKFMELAQKQSLIKVNFVPAENLNHGAAMGFIVLGSRAGNAVPALVRIWQEDISESSLHGVALVLAGIGPAASQAIPAMLQSLNNTNEAVRGYAASFLGSIHSEPNVVVPALVKCLNDPDPFVQVNAATALLYFGSDAKAAVPALLDVLKDPNASAKAVTETARDALREIDPEAAAKAGIK